MALFSGRLFAGALFAGAIFAAGQQVEAPVVEPSYQSALPSYGYAAKQTYSAPGHAWVKVQKTCKGHGYAPDVETNSLCSRSVLAARGVAESPEVRWHAKSGSMVKPKRAGFAAPQTVFGSRSEVPVGVAYSAYRTGTVRIQLVDGDELLSLLMA